jgi:hypothetical protein
MSTELSCEGPEGIKQGLPLNHPGSLQDPQTFPIPIESILPDPTLTLKERTISLETAEKALKTNTNAGFIILKTMGAFSVALTILGLLSLFTPPGLIVIVVTMSVVVIGTLCHSYYRTRQLEKQIEQQKKDIAELSRDLTLQQLEKQVEQQKEDIAELQNILLQQNGRKPQDRQIEGATGIENIVTFM